MGLRLFFLQAMTMPGKAEAETVNLPAFELKNQVEICSKIHFQFSCIILILYSMYHYINITFLMLSVIYWRTKETVYI